MQTHRRLLHAFRPYLISTFIFLCFLHVNSKPHHRHSSASELEWGEWNKCPIDSFVAGISLRLRDTDATESSPTITGVRLYCTRQHVLSERDNDFVETIIQVDSAGQSSKWFEPVFCNGGVANEFKVKYAIINGHQTVTNLRLVCSDGETLKTHGHGKDKGDSTESFVCPPRHAICGLQTRVLPEVEHGGNILTDAKVHCCDVKNPATHCVLTDKWQFVTDCINSEAILPETCGFEKRVGTSYAGKEKETTIYENLGFTLNGVATDLSAKAHDVMEDRSPSDYNWGNAKSNVWMPEIKTNDSVVAFPRIKLQVYQLVGYCGFYRIRNSEFRYDTTEALKTASDIAAQQPAVEKDEEKEKTESDHDPNIQSDFGGFKDDDDDWGSDWDDDELTADDTDTREEEKKPDNKDEKEESDEFEGWGDSVEEKTDDKKDDENINKKDESSDSDNDSEEVKPTETKEKTQESDEKPDNKDKKEESDEFDGWGDSAEEKLDDKKEDENTNKKDESSDSDNDSEKKKPTETKDKTQESDEVDGFGFSEEKKSDETKDEGEKNKDSEEVNESAEDLIDSEENKPLTHENDQPAPIPPTSDTQKDEDENEDSFDDWDNSDDETDSHDTKADNSPPVAPTIEEQLPEKKVSGEESSENKKDEISDPKPTDPETNVDGTVHHEPLTKEESDFDRDDQWDTGSEEGTHEQKVNNARPPTDSEKKTKVEESKEESKSDSSEEDNKNVSIDEVIDSDKHEKDEEKSDKNDKDHDELMAKDQPNDDDDEWDAFDEVDNDEHNHNDHDSHEVEVNTKEKSHDVVKEDLKMAETEAPVAEDEYDLFDGFNVDIPESNSDQFERQVGEPKQSEESSNDNDHAGTILGDPSTFLKDTVDNVVQSVQENIAPLADELEKAVEDIKEMPIVKDPHKTISELLDSADSKDTEPSHQDNDEDEAAEPNKETDGGEAPSADENQGEPPKIQSAVLGYIVGGMVAVVVVVVVIIFVLERRKTEPKRFPQEADKISGGVRDPPLLSGYRKGSTEAPLAVSGDKDAF